MLMWQSFSFKTFQSLGPLKERELSLILLSELFFSLTVSPDDRKFLPVMYSWIDSTKYIAD